MALFFFDVLDDHGLTPAGEGLELASMDAAIREAKKAAGEMVGEALIKDTHGPLEIHIRTVGPAEVVLRLTWLLERPVNPLVQAIG